ncbi:uncharacterized protein METZ01_LOCUS257568, partial [marine metagenome]
MIMLIRSIIHSMSILIFLMGSLLFAMPDRRASLSTATPTGAENENCTVTINYLDDAGDLALAQGTVYFTIAVGTNNPITATGDYADITEEGDEYGVGAYTISPNMVTSSTLTIGVVADKRYEHDEEFTITLTNATGSVNLTGSPITAATFTLTNDDDLPKFAFSTPTSNEEEGTAKEIDVVVEATGGDVGRDVDVTWSLVDTETSTADHASDEEGTLSFTEGEDSKTITYLSEEDELHEGDESFVLNLTGYGTTGSSGSQTAHTHTINDDDEVPTVGFSVTEMNKDEDHGSVTVTFSLEGQTTSATSVSYAIKSEGTTATSEGDDPDHNLSASSVNFSA